MTCEFIFVSTGADKDKWIRLCLVIVSETNRSFLILPSTDGDRLVVEL